MVLEARCWHDENDGREAWYFDEEAANMRREVVLWCLLLCPNGAVESNLRHNKQATSTKHKAQATKKRSCKLLKVAVRKRSGFFPSGREERRMRCPLSLCPRRANTKSYLLGIFGYHDAKFKSVQI